VALYSVVPSDFRSMLQVISAARLRQLLDNPVLRRLVRRASAIWGTGRRAGRKPG